MFPGVRVMAVSMSGVEMTRAGISSMPTARVNRQLVILVEEQPPIGTAPALPCEPGGQPGADRRVASPSRAPVDPIPIVRASVACDLGGPPAGDLTRGGERHLACGGGRCGTHPAGVPSRPVPVIHPPGRGVGVSPAGPVAALHPRAMIHPTAGGLTHPGPIIMGPTAHLRVELPAQGRLGPGPTAAHEPPERCQMCLDGDRRRWEQRVAPEPLVAPGSLPGWVGSPPLLTAVAPQTVQAGLIPFHGVAEVRVRHVQRQSDRRQPGHAEVLAVCEDRALVMEDPAVIGVGHDAGLRIDLGAGRVHPRQGDQRPSR